MTSPAVVREPSQRVKYLRQPSRPLLRHIITLNTTQHNTKTINITSRPGSVTVKSQMTISNGPNDSNYGSGYRASLTDGARSGDAGFGAQS